MSARLGTKAAATLGALTITKHLTSKQHNRVDALRSELPRLQHELFTLGLTQTSAQLGRALEVFGWEIAAILEREDRVQRSVLKDREYRR